MNYGSCWFHSLIPKCATDSQCDPWQSASSFKMQINNLLGAVCMFFRAGFSIFIVTKQLWFFLCVCVSGLLRDITFILNTETKWQMFCSCLIGYSDNTRQSVDALPCVSMWKSLTAWTAVFLKWVRRLKPKDSFSFTLKGQTKTIQVSVS